MEQENRMDKEKRKVLIKSILEKQQQIINLKDSIMEDFCKVDKDSWDVKNMSYDASEYERLTRNLQDRLSFYMKMHEMSYKKLTQEVIDQHKLLTEDDVFIKLYDATENFVKKDEKLKELWNYMKQGYMIEEEKNDFFTNYTYHVLNRGKQMIKDVYIDTTAFLYVLLETWQNKLPNYLKKSEHSFIFRSHYCFTRATVKKIIALEEKRQKEVDINTDTMVDIQKVLSDTTNLEERKKLLEERKEEFNNRIHLPEEKPCITIKKIK